MRLTEAPEKRQRTEETTDKKNPGSRGRCTGPQRGVLLGDEDGNEEEKREQGERAPQSTFPSRGARVSVETLILAGPRTGAS